MLKFTGVYTKNPVVGETGFSTTTAALNDTGFARGVGFACWAALSLALW
jgi:hypothetical protein